MDIKLARAICGNQSKHSLKMMIKALELPISQFLNTADDWQRLEAAKYLLKHSK